MNNELNRETINKYDAIMHLIFNNKEYEEEFTGELLRFFNQICDDSMFLEALENNGVDNWTYYGEAFKDYLKIKDGEENSND